MTPEQAKALNIGDVYYEVVVSVVLPAGVQSDMRYWHASSQKSEKAHISVQEQKMTSNRLGLSNNHSQWWHAHNFVTREEAEDAAEMLRIKNALQE